MFKCEPVKNRIEEILTEFATDIEGINCHAYFEFREGIKKATKAIESEFEKRCEGLNNERLLKIITQRLEEYGMPKFKDYYPALEVLGIVVGAIETHLRGEK